MQDFCNESLSWHKASLHWVISRLAVWDDTKSILSPGSSRYVKWWREKICKTAEHVTSKSRELTGVRKANDIPRDVGVDSNKKK